MIKPGSCPRPLALNRSRRNAKHFGALFVGKSAEESQLNDSASLRIDLCQAFERFIEGQ